MSGKKRGYILTLVNPAASYDEQEKNGPERLYWRVRRYPVKDKSLQALQEEVGGYIEHFTLYHMPGHYDCWINDEGAINGLPMTYPLCDPHGLNCTGALFGNMAFTWSDQEGESHGLTGDDVRYIMEHLTPSGWSLPQNIAPYEIQLLGSVKLEEIFPN